MYAKSTRPSAKRDIQKFRSAQRDDQIARPRQIFLYSFLLIFITNNNIIYYHYPA